MEHRNGTKSSVKELIGTQRKSSKSPNPFERVVGSLSLAALLRSKLAALSNRAIGHLMFDYVWNELNLLGPEMTICIEATARLLGHEPGGRMMTKVWQQALFVGSLKDAEQLALANPMGIAAVLSLCPEKIERKRPDIHYMRIPIPDAQPISMRQFEDIMGAIEQGLRRGNLLIHCAAGYSRSPIMAAAWMHRCEYLNFDAGMQRIAQLRPITDPSPILLRSVKEHLNR